MIKFLLILFSIHSSSNLNKKKFQKTIKYFLNLSTPKKIFLLFLITSYLLFFFFTIKHLFFNNKKIQISNNNQENNNDANNQKIQCSNNNEENNNNLNNQEIQISNNNQENNTNFNHQNFINYFFVGDNNDLFRYRSKAIVNVNEYCLFNNINAIFLNNKFEVIKKLEVDKLSDNIFILKNIENKDESFLVYKQNIENNQIQEIFPITHFSENNSVTNSKNNSVTIKINNNQNQEIEFVFNIKNNDCLITSKTTKTINFPESMPDFPSKIEEKIEYNDNRNITKKTIITYDRESKVQSKIEVTNTYDNYSNIKSQNITTFDGQSNVQSTIKVTNIYCINFVTEQTITTLDGQSNVQSTIKVTNIYDNYSNIESQTIITYDGQSKVQSTIKVENEDYNYSTPNKQTITTLDGQSNVQSITVVEYIRYRIPEQLKEICNMNDIDINSQKLQFKIITTYNKKNTQFEKQTISISILDDYANEQKIIYYDYINGDEEKIVATRTLDLEYDHLGIFCTKRTQTPEPQLQFQQLTSSNIL